MPILNSGPLSLGAIRDEFLGTSSNVSFREYNRGGEYVPNIPINNKITLTAGTESKFSDYRGASVFGAAVEVVSIVAEPSSEYGHSYSGSVTIRIQGSSKFYKIASSGLISGDYARNTNIGIGGLNGSSDIAYSVRITDLKFNYMWDIVIACGGGAGWANGPAGDGGPTTAGGQAGYVSYNGSKYYNNQVFELPKHGIYGGA